MDKIIQSMNKLEFPSQYHHHHTFHLWFDSFVEMHIDVAPALITMMNHCAVLHSSNKPSSPYDFPFSDEDHAYVQLAISSISPTAMPIIC
jgi:hypothetical protein